VLMREFIDRLLGRLLIVVAGLAAVSLVAQYGFYLPARYSDLIVRLDVGIIIFFIAESFVRLLISKEKSEYLRSHWIDFAIIGLLAAQVISLRFFSGSQVISGFLNRLNIRSVTKAYIIAVQLYIGAVLFSKTIEANKFVTRLNLNAPQVVLLSFAAAIGVGTLLLLMPRATATGHSMRFVDALFTATSATCVTGLIVVDTGSYFSTLGQGIILALIQIGGLGIMSLTAFAAVVIGKGMGMRESALMKDILSSDFIGEVNRLLRDIVIITVIFEVAGLLVLSRIWASDFRSLGVTFYYSLFHSVSAFCNAGFSLFSDSLEGFAGRYEVVLTFAALIVIGGLGFMVISNLGAWFAGKIRRGPTGTRLSLHTRTVLVASVVLLVLGTVVFYALEARESLAPMSTGQKVVSSFFASVTARTAGFNTTSMAAIAAPTALVIILLMFIGASPGGTGGGVKTSTLTVLAATVRSILRGRKNVEFFRRTLPQDVVNKAIVVVLLSSGLVFVSSVGISIAEGKPLTDVLFETVSAFGTVGLSRGLTQDLTMSSKIVIIITMFFGRIGPLTLGLAIGQKAREAAYSYPVERVMIG
jgi:trk system potassium uptake protein TrkH